MVAVHAGRRQCGSAAHLTALCRGGTLSIYYPGATLMRIGLLADIHANLPALEAAYASLTAASCDVIVNLGDAITIGPYPAETLDFLRARGIS